MLRRRGLRVPYANPAPGRAATCWGRPHLASVIVTTFNREDALDAVLRSLSIQGDRDFEVIVADDGSGAATVKLIDAWKPKFAGRLEHIWHADEGFRAAEIRNRAILAARGAVIHAVPDGDVTSLWLSTIAPAWRRGPVAIAGLTRPPVLRTYGAMRRSRGK